MGPNSSLVFIIHGFLSTGNGSWMIDLARAVHGEGDHIVFRVDWSNGADTYNYAKAVVNTDAVSKDLMEFIFHLVTNFQVKMSDVHLVGHSLGAHVAGQTGKLIQSYNYGPIGRITGLDPAGPCFDYWPHWTGLTQDSASLVVQISTDTPDPFGFGTDQLRGHINFAANGGSSQPGCDAWDELFDFSCSHSRAYMYFTTVVSGNCTYTGTECPDYTFYTEGDCGDCQEGNGTTCLPLNFKMEKINTDFSTTRFFFRTNSEPPFCQV